MVVGDSQSSLIQVMDSKICRDMNSMNLTTRQSKKDYRFIFDKRVKTDSYITYPYGYWIKAKPYNRCLVNVFDIGKRGTAIMAMEVYDLPYSNTKIWRFEIGYL